MEEELEIWVLEGQIFVSIMSRSARTGWILTPRSLAGVFS